MDVSDLHLRPEGTLKHSNTIQEGEKPDSNNAKNWPVYKELLEGPILFAVMGVTGSGKSNFINLSGAKRKTLSGQKAQRPLVGHTMESETQDVQVYELYHNSRHIILVDTPGFDDSQKGDAEILELLANWFAISYYFKQALVGVIYLHPITDNRMRDSTRRNIDLFQKLCGLEAMKTVTLITTMWDKDSSKEEQTYLNREEYLKETSWITMTTRGAAVLRSRNKKTDMPALIDKILSKCSPVKLTVQTQLVDDKLTLADTDPGKVLMKNIRTSHNDKIGEMQAIKELCREYQADGQRHEKLEARLAQILEEIQAEEHARKRLETWTFESVVTGILGTAMVGGLGAGVYGATYSMYIGALAIGLLPGIATGIAVVGIGTAFTALINRFRADPPKNTKGTGTKTTNPGDQYITESRLVEEPEMNTLVGTPSLRLSNPTLYFEELEELKQAIFEQSGVAGYAATVTGPQPGYVSSTQAHHAHDGRATVKDQLDDLKIVDHKDFKDQPSDKSVTEDSVRIPAPRLPILACSPPGFRKSTERLNSKYLKRPDHSVEEPIYRKLFHLLECRNVAQRIMWNVCRLQQTGYISDRISLVTMDKGRKNVACLKSISMRQIEELIEVFTKSANAASEDETVDYQLLTSYSKGFLTSVDLSRRIEPKERGSIGKTVNRDNDPFIWRCAIHTLDLAVILYAGAHTEHIGEEYSDTPISSFHVPGPYFTSNFSTSAEYASIVYRRRLQCLDGLLNGVGVWVFHSDSGKPPDPDLDMPPLHLATQSKTLSDIWGPMWEEKVEGGTLRSPRILRYKIGNGSIIPWSPSEAVKLLDGEIYCHWVSDSDEIDANTASKTRFEGTETLMIGAKPDFEVNESCRQMKRLDAVINNLRHADRITSLKTAEDTWVLDTRSHAIQGGISHVGILNSTISRVYKLRTRTWRMSMLEAWDPANEDGEPENLERYMGLEISLCTGNASRVSVSSIILSESMRRFFDPSTPNDFITALEPRRHEPNIIQTLWRDHPEWCKDISKSVHKCLKALDYTGLMNERKGPRLQALWNPGSIIAASKISFEKCGWMDMLSESNKNSCLAVAVTKCLNSDHRDLRRCQAHLGPNDTPQGKSALRTSFTLNESENPFGLMVGSAGHWQCSSKCKGKCFKLSNQGAWQVAAVLDSQTDNHGLLMKKVVPVVNRKSVKVIEFDGSDLSNPSLPVLLR